MSTTEALKLDNFLIPASQLSDRTGRIFQSLLSVDIALSGGIPEGINMLISGSPKIGKSSFSLYFAGQCQQADPEKQVFFFDCEGRLRPELLATIDCLDLKRFNIIRSNEKKILSAENYLNLILNTLKDYPGCICILDSIASLAPEAELSSLIGDSVKMAGIASLMYKVFRHTSQILSVTNSTFVGLTHLIANPSPGPGKKSFYVGGRAIGYGASVHIECNYKTDIKYGERLVGQTAKFKVIASALGPPAANVDVPIIWGKGIHRPTDLFNVGLEMGVIKKAGAWYEVPYKDDIFKLQGQENVVEFLEQNPHIQDQIETDIRKMVFG